MCMLCSLSFNLLFLIKLLTPFQDICPLLFKEAQAGAAAPPDKDAELPTAKDVSVAYCSMAEIYLTDLWY